MAGLLIALAVAGAAPAAPAAASRSLEAAGAAACAAKVRIAGKPTCLAVGKSCKRRHESRYRSKGFTCKRNASGRFTLRRVKQSF